MSKKCARCDKTVYPIEELKCLDKIWHKSCFKCDECGMTLNMKTYKGFNKLPYCNAHTPVARATTVADTPENRRLAENTKIQSQVKYHADFEKEKGKVTQVADDPETLRIRNTSKIISNVTYHGDYEKKKQMESRRNLLENENGNIPPMYIPVDKATAKNMAAYANNNNIPAVPQQQPVLKNTNIDYHQRNAAPYGAYGNNNGNPAPVQSAKVVTTAIPANPNANYLTDHQRYVNSQIPPQMAPPQQYHHQAPPQQQPQYHQQSPIQHQQQQQHLPQHHQQPQMQQHQPQQLSHDSRYYSGAQAQQNVAKPYGGVTNLGRCFRAIYDYTAQDVDEVSFIDGDLIIHCQPIDDGWMLGTVQRSGVRGMLPSNYVETA